MYLSTESERIRCENEELKRRLGRMSLSTESERIRCENEELKRKLAYPSYPDLTIEVKLADSGQAIVYKGQFKGTSVAVKVFKDISPTDFRVELESLLLVGSHPNIVKLLTLYENPVPCVVTVFLPNGDLFHYLKKHGAQVIVEAKRLALGIAHGIEYLHSQNLIHRDIKSPNILLNEHLNCVIADFGQSKLSKKTLTTASHANLGTYQWMAPEMMNEEIKYSNKIDVYALGIILWELLSGQVPYASSDLNVFQFIIYVKAGKRLPINSVWDLGLVQLIQQCWQQNPVDRPTMSQVVKALSEESKTVLEERQREEDREELRKREEERQREELRKIEEERQREELRKREEERQREELRKREEERWRWRNREEERQREELRKREEEKRQREELRKREEEKWRPKPLSALERFLKQNPEYQQTPQGKWWKI